MPFFIAKDGQTFGPHEPEEIAIFLGTGDFHPEDFCWQEGWPEWRPISSVLPSKPVPAAPSAVAAAPPISPSPRPEQLGQIPEDIEILGTLKLPGDRTVTCRVEGEILCPSTVTIAREAKIKARIKAESVVIFGEVEGEIRVSGRAVLKGTSTLVGDIHASRVLVEEGATFSGKSHVKSRTTHEAIKTKSGSAKKSPPSKLTAKIPS